MITPDQTHAVEVYAEQTPNPASLKFVTNKVLYKGKSADFPDKVTAKGVPLAEALFEQLDFVAHVFISDNFVSVTKQEEVAWEEVMDQVRRFIHDWLVQGKMVIPADFNQPPQNTSADDEAVRKKIDELLEAYIQPAVAMDGGAIKFKSYHNGVVHVSFQGACNGCPSSLVTLKNGVEGILTRMVPEVQSVEAEEEV